MPRKKKDVLPPKQQVIVSLCDLHGRYICNPAEKPVCPCCKCKYRSFKEDRDHDSDMARDFRYEVISEVESPLLAGEKEDEMIVVPVHEILKYMEVEFHNGVMVCPCCCCLRDEQLTERYGKNIEKELEYDKNVDILIKECNRKELKNVE